MRKQRKEWTKRVKNLPNANVLSINLYLKFFFLNLTFSSDIYLIVDLVCTKKVEMGPTLDFYRQSLLFYRFGL